MSVRYVLAPQAALDLFEIWRYIKEQILRDLESRSLMTGSGMHSMMTVQGMFAARITAMGSEIPAFHFA